MKFLYTTITHGSKKKQRALSWLTGIDPAIKRKVIMRIQLTAFLILFTMLHVWASGSAQQLTMTYNNVPLKTVLEDITTQSGYRLWLNDRLLEQSRTVSINVKEASLKEVLDKCFENQPLTYEITNKTIVIRQKPISLKDKLISLLNAIKITGTVKDEQGQPMPGVNILIKGTRKGTTSKTDGSYTIEAEENDILVFSFLGYHSQEIPINATPQINITLKENSTSLEAAQIVSTGYQSLPKERTTGSFVQIDKDLFNRRVSTNILERLDGISAGVYFNNTPPAIATNPNLKNSGINIRGISTFYSSTDPLIVVDNFPYDGEISNINPNDVESVTILKDAAAASIWGARSGNGVIVITTKTGMLNQKMNIDFNSNFSTVNRPNLFYNKAFLNAKDYIQVEQTLFDKGYFDTYLQDNFTKPSVSPAVELMAKYKAASSDTERLQIQSQIEILESKDVRDDYNKYVYQQAVKQQYSLNLRGGGDKMTYSVSIGHDNNQDNLVRNGFQRTTFNTLNTYKPIKGLELTAGINFSQNTTINNNQFAFGVFSELGAPYLTLYPYAQFADQNGNPLALPHGIRESYLNEAEGKGFMDWHYRPLDEIKIADFTTNISDYLIRTGAKYQIIPQLSINLNYQNEKQVIRIRNLQTDDSYYTRNMINKFALYDAANNKFTYRFPQGDILGTQNYDWNANNFRGQLNYDQSFNKHTVTAIAGAEIKELKTEGFNRTSYGYNDQFGTATMSLDYLNFLDINPGGSEKIPSPSASITGTLRRYISYFANAAYTYNSRYTINVSGRKDGANLFGATTNNKITPLWSAGLGWNISKEDFYDFSPFPYLQLRATYGFNGNIYQNGSAYLTGNYSTAATGARRIASTTAPNAELKWERVKNTNLAVDFASKNSVISGSIEYYRKNGEDLIQPTNLAFQTGFSSYMANTANTKSTGWDVTLNTRNISGDFSWTTTLLFSNVKDKIVKFDTPLDPFSIQSNMRVVGKPLNALFSYKWAGLNSENGNPRGYLNGVVSEDYLSISNSFNPDSLVYDGSTVPTSFGSFRNDFSYKGFNLSFNITYQVGFVFRRRTVGLDYANILQFGQHSDYSSRWQKTGDEKITNVPSLVYPSDYNRDAFYQFSEILVEKGDHIRFQDIRLGYTFPKIGVLSKIKSLQIYGYGNNLGIIWRKNKLGIDPLANGTGAFPNPFSLSLGLSANF